MKNLLLLSMSVVASCGIAYAEKGDLLVRGRAIVVAPTEESSGVNPAFPGGEVGVEDAVVPELDFTYFVADNWGVELILATSPHDLTGEADLSGLGQIGETWALPPTVTLQYHFHPEASFRPYAGVGLNYTTFYNEKASTSLNDAIGATSIRLDDSFGVAFQLGFDVDASDNWFFNADVKYIQIDTTAKLNTSGTINEVDVDLDPIVAGLGFGRKF